MSSRLSRLAVGVIALMIAGGAVACPGAKNKTSADQGRGSGALHSSTSGRT